MNPVRPFAACLRSVAAANSHVQVFYLTKTSKMMRSGRDRTQLISLSVKTRLARDPTWKLLVLEAIH